MTDYPPTWGRSRAPRLPGRAYPPGHSIHVTICALSRRPVFENRRVARPVFEHCCTVSNLAALCLMPDHLHLLLLDARAASAEVARLKSETTRLAWAAGVSGRLWQRSFHDHVLRSNERLGTVAAYIRDNPVRAGLVEAAEDYPYSKVFLDRLC